MTHETKASRLPSEDSGAKIEKARQWHQQRAAAQPSAEEATMEHAAAERRIRGNSVVIDAWRKAKNTLPTMPPSVAVKPASAVADELEAVLREFTVKRDDNRPLRFVGHLVGFNEVDPEAPRGTAVIVFVTKRGKIITAAHQWQRDTKRDRERHAAAVHEHADDALAWLIEDGGGHLGRSSREAWDMACLVWPSLQGHEVEIVE